MPDLWPQVPPFAEGDLAVSELHTIHYALYGNRHGVPVFFLHGGPGCGCSDDDARWFDPDRYLVATHDQRGSGRSRPWAETRENTPHDLVADIETLRRHLQLERPLLIFAGSWGTTLALLYAETHPNRVAAMILRGIFTCGYADQDYFYSADGAARFSPAAWERFIASLPPGDDRIQDRLHRLFAEADDAGQRHWFAVQAAYEYSFFGEFPREPGEVAALFDQHYAEMRINSHYQAHRFFLDDGQLLDQADRIAHIPVAIVHGMRDVICPPAVAWRLHRRLPNSSLSLIENAGHLSSDPPITDALLQAVAEWAVDRS